MNRIIVVVEGQSEEEFIKRTVAPYLLMRNISMTPIVVRTGKNVKGGLSSYQKFKNDVVGYLKQDNSIIVTSMIDYFRIPTSFPSYDSLGNVQFVDDKVTHLERGMFDDINDSRFIAYIQLHEFEALLFSDIKGFQGISEYSGRNSEKIIKEISQILEEYDSPEMINSRPELAPSKRILKIIPEYNKVLFGSIIAEEIGMETIRAKCSRFDEWIQTIIDRFQ